MRKLLLIISLLFVFPVGCASDDNEGEDVSGASIIGKWNLVSDIQELTTGEVVEGITVCQSAYWQFNFINNDELKWRTTTDESGVPLSECDPGIYDGIYNITDDYDFITTTIYFPTWDETLMWKIETLTNSVLILRTPDSADYLRKWTFEKD